MRDRDCFRHEIHHAVARFPGPLAQAMRHIVPALSLCLATALPAQQLVQGRITDQTSAFPLAGVVVSGVDSAGETLARTVSDSASGFRLPLLAGMIKLQFRRIGYAPATR